MPGFLAQLTGHRLNRACPGRRIGNAPQVGFLLQDKLRVACNAPGKHVWQAQWQRMRQYRDRIRAASCGGKCREGCAQHVHRRIASRHHPPSGLGVNCDRARCYGGCALDTLPQATQGAQLRDPDKLVGIDGDGPRQRGECVGDRHAIAFEHTRISNAAGQSCRQFLCFRCTGLTEGPHVASNEWTLEVACFERGNASAQKSARFHPCGVHRAGDGRYADRIQSKVDRQPSWIVLAAFDECCHPFSDAVACQRWFDAQLDHIQHDIGQAGIEGVDAVREQAKAARGESPLENQRQAVGAAFEVVTSKRGCVRRCWMIDARGDAPRPACSGSRHCCGIRPPPINRLDIEFIVCFRHEPPEIAAL